MTIARPHRGYHGPRGSQRFFEGWYYRVSLPEASFATIYSIEDPHGGPLSQGAVQVLTATEVAVECFPQVKNFWADPDALAFGQVQAATPRVGLQLSAPFWDQLQTGYQATASLNQGRVRTDRGEFSWDYRITPILGWGRDEATMGLLSYLPVYEVGWQVCMAHGWATGHFTTPSQQHNFTHAPAYIEKNWSLGFPKIWFWLQANDFTVVQGLPDPNLTVTSGGGARRTLGWEDEAALVGLHYQGRFFNFRPETGSVQWQVQTDTQQGHWQIWAGADGYEIELIAGVPRTKLQALLGPSPTRTLHPISLHSLAGQLTLKLYRGRGAQRVLILEAESQTTAVEVGGERWAGTWAGRC
ncbi:tocopherol cyclase family protein [Candidatus Cyanaurora vandensis]|uniref:tocopherol cyclase family protein n=1 Tax=Candidatus Cyanaurora vandensis TaxID=2714958 RepID=UPI002580499B|nr:tocopherol cyclase family protein [Candidatus Cyanaurora vandensis]